MPVFERKRDQMIEHQNKRSLADELHDSLAEYLIERALDEASAGDFKSGNRGNAPQ